jgi:hypothetical protein
LDHGAKVRARLAKLAKPKGRVGAMAKLRDFAMIEADYYDRREMARENPVWTFNRAPVHEPSNFVGASAINMTINP